MSNIILSVIIAAFASSGLWTLITTIYLNEFRKKSAGVKMLIGIGHDRLFELCNTYLNRGSITPEELDNLLAIYEPYTELGGNGTGKFLMEEVKRLPIIKKED